MSGNLPYITKEKIAGTESIRLMYWEEFATRCIPFQSVITASLQFLEKKWDCFGVPSLVTEIAILKNHSSLATSVLDECQAPQAASTVANDVDYDDDWNLEGSLGLDDVKRIVVTWHLFFSQDSWRAEKLNVPGTGAGVFGFATE